MTHPLEELIDEVRLTFHAFRNFVVDLHEGAIEPRHRAMLEFLQRRGPHTVPDIARARGVTRQHIQVIANELREQGLVRPSDNPAHRRSPLFELTDAGARSIASVLDVEQSQLDRVAAALDADGVRQTTDTLRAIRVLISEKETTS